MVNDHLSQQQLKKVLSGEIMCVQNSGKSQIIYIVLVYEEKMFYLKVVEVYILHTTNLTK